MRLRWASGAGGLYSNIDLCAGFAGLYFLRERLFLEELVVLTSAVAMGDDGIFDEEGH